MRNALAKGRHNGGAIKTPNSDDKGMADFFAITDVHILTVGQVFGVALHEFGAGLFSG